MTTTTTRLEKKSHLIVTIWHILLGWWLIPGAGMMYSGHFLSGLGITALSWLLVGFLPVAEVVLIPVAMVLAYYWVSEHNKCVDAQASEAKASEPAKAMDILILEGKRYVAIDGKLLPVPE